jgi:hypothetical protein
VLITVGVLLACAVAYAGFQWGWWALIAPLVPFLGVVGVLARLAVKNTLVEVLADASRWFGPRPQDVAARDAVRRIGLQLLESLHAPDEKGRPRYGRIVVIGHSLGSVIAYDVLRLAFDKLRKPAALEEAAKATPLQERQPAAWHFNSEITRLEDDTDRDQGLNYFRHVQRQLHREQREHGVQWQVTDLITVGSPLAHAPDLWRSKAVDFEMRIDETEFPACPPVGDLQHSEGRRAAKRKPVPDGAADKPVCFYRQADEGPLIAHDASVFATTRWTNLYVPMRFWLGGDPVGGEVAPVFGPGVWDIPVRVSVPPGQRWKVLAIPMRAHTWYWKRHRHLDARKIREEKGPRDAVQMLERVVALKEHTPDAYKFR